MRPVIAVPYFPGSNGDVDSIDRIREFGMKPLPLYFHIGDEKRLEQNARILAEQVDGAVLPGGFPYEDRIDFGVVPAKITQFSTALRGMVEKGKPVIAFCSGDQIAQYIGLAFPAGSDLRVKMLRNIYDTSGSFVSEGFLDARPYLKLECPPERTAFTRWFTSGEVMEGIIDHGGGRFWADHATLQYLLNNGLIVTRYSDAKGDVVDNFPINPNGSMLNIESITNNRGNIKIGMAHNERKLNALQQDRANRVFASMREFIEDGCPDLSSHAARQDIPIVLKDYSYLSQALDPRRTIDIYVKMLTDDNERTTAQLFLNGKVDLDRRRLLRIELGSEPQKDATIPVVVQEIASMELLDGIMLKKDLPVIKAPGMQLWSYEVVGKQDGRLIREFVPREAVVEGFPVMHTEIPLPNPGGYAVRQALRKNPVLHELVSNVHLGRAWFFPDEQAKKIALEELLG